MTTCVENEEGTRKNKCLDELELETEDKMEMLRLVDILVDGRYDFRKRDLTLQFRGSSNQRIIDVQESLKQDAIILWKKLQK